MSSAVTNYSTGDTATLTCASLGADEYTFFIGDNQLGSGFTSSANFTIASFAVTNDGIYSCLGRNGAGNSGNSNSLSIALSKFPYGLRFFWVILMGVYLGDLIKFRTVNIY